MPFIGNEYGLLSTLFAIVSVSDSVHERSIEMTHNAHSSLTTLDDEHYIA